MGEILLEATFVLQTLWEHIVFALEPSRAALFPMNLVIVAFTGAPIAVPPYLHVDTRAKHLAAPPRVVNLCGYVRTPGFPCGARGIVNSLHGLLLNALTCHRHCHARTLCGAFGSGTYNTSHCLQIPDAWYVANQGMSMAKIAGILAWCRYLNIPACPTLFGAFPATFLPRFVAQSLRINDRRRSGASVLV